MKPILVSLLVHEHSDVVLDQVRNINIFVPEAKIIIHMNPSFLGDIQPILDEEKKNASIIVNKNRIPVAWADLIQAHNSNFYFATQNNIEFSHFCLHASNDMFVKHGLETFVRQHRCGVNTFETFHNMEWTPRRRAEHDEQFQAMLKYLDTDKIMCSQPEGTFYDRELFQEMMNVMDRFFDRSQVKSYTTKNDSDHSNTLYAREEVFYPTLAAKLQKNIVFPYVFSEVMAWTQMSVKLIDAVRNNSLAPDYCLERRLFKTRTPQMYDQQSLFAVKRIARRFDDPLRQYIRGFTHGDLRRTQTEPLPNIER